MNLILSKIFHCCLTIDWLVKPLFLLGAWRKCLIHGSQVECLKRIVNPAKNSLDIGAHYGAITYYVAKLSPRVYAYEPNRECFEFLVRAVAKNVTVINQGVSDRVGKTSLYVPIGAKDRSALGSFHKSVFPEGQTLVDTVVKVTNLDHEGYSNVGFIKIDTEGHELNIIEGAKKLLAAEKPNLMIEISSKNIELVSQLTRDYGYSVFLMDQGRWKKVLRGDRGGDYLFLQEHGC
jgi:FkbM family methyltransferase